jgi:hypothetical protein
MLDELDMDELSEALKVYIKGILEVTINDNKIQKFNSN